MRFGTPSANRAAVLLVWKHMVCSRTCTHPRTQCLLSPSYCNSIVQCLYYSVPFREQVINFPARSPPEALERPESSLPRLNTNLTNGQSTALSPAGRTSVSSPTSKAPVKPATPGAPNQPPGIKPEDNKDSPEYKKKQALAAGPVLQMDYENANSYGMNESLFSSLKDIFEAIIAHRSRIGVVSPHKLLEILRRDNEMFRTPMHQDAHEFLNLLLNEVVENVEHFSKTRLAEASAAEEDDDRTTVTSGDVVPARSSVTSTKSNSGWVHELFEGTLTSETRCLTCENTSQRDEAFLDLSVDLEQHSSVTSCLRKFSEEEMLCERNKFHCDNCGGLQEAEKRMKIMRLPKILALHLKRFKYTEDLQRLQKLFHRVVYPFYLRLFNTTDDAEDPDRLYELYAVVVHIGGGPYHGHYVSIIKTQDRGWLLFDDEMVEPVDKAYVRNFFGGENVLACAYVLFYQETTEEAMMKEQEADALAAAEQAAKMAQEDVTTPKQNGTNGTPYHVFHNATTPSVEEADKFASLAHAATAPAVAHVETNVETPPVEHTTTHVPALAPRKSNLGLFEKGKEKKERKAHEKELERQAKQKRREMEIQRRENYRKQEEELRAVLEASKASAVEEEKKRVASGEVPSPSPSPAPAPVAVLGGDKEKHVNGFGHVKGMSGLNRFRHTSISLKTKPKFWSAHKDKDGSADEHNPPDTPTHESHEKDGRNRFSLGRKKSTFKF